jgi:DNA-binding NtrC family response regulator
LRLRAEAILKAERRSYGRKEREKEMTLKKLLKLPLDEARKAFERQYLRDQIDRFGGNITRTAEFVGMERSALHRKLHHLGVARRGAA